MRPTTAKEQALNRMAGARRWVWNWALAPVERHLRGHGKSIPLKQLSAELTALKKQPETAWLKEVDSQALQQVLKDLHRAFTNFFEKRPATPGSRAGSGTRCGSASPSGSRSRTARSTSPRSARSASARASPSKGPTKSATFRRDAVGHWYVTLTVEFEMPDVALPPPDPREVVGIDLGLKDFATITGAQARSRPPSSSARGNETRRAQRVVSRRKPGSKRKAKAKRRVARVHQKIANQRGGLPPQADHQARSASTTASASRICRSRALREPSWPRASRMPRWASSAVNWRTSASGTASTWSVIDRFFPSTRCAGAAERSTRAHALGSAVGLRLRDGPRS